MISLSASDLNSILRHLEREYPLEGCGLLYGKRTPDEDVVLWFAAIKSVNTTQLPDWFELDPQASLWVDTDARKEGLTLLGIVHSHPNHPAAPSPRDLERAWPDLNYFIASIRGDRERGEAAEWTTWWLNEADKKFDPVIVKLRRDPVAGQRPAVIYTTRTPAPLPD